MKGCREVAAELGLTVPEKWFLPVECCVSCHDDANEGYDELIWYADGGPDAAQICCAILRLLPDQY